MGANTGANRCVFKVVFPIAMTVIQFTMATTLGLAATPNPETIQATYSQAGSPIGVTLIVYNYSTAADLQALLQSFLEGQDRALGIALSKTKAVGRCLIKGEISYDLAFIQVVLNADWPANHLYHQPTASIG